MKFWARQLSTFVTAREQPATGILWPLFLVSFATLYVEIMLIRWIGTEVRVFAYFQNLTLICCFLGFGLGCYWSERPKNRLLGLVAMVGLIVLVEIPIVPWKNFLAGLSSLLSLSPDAVLWGSGRDLGSEAPFLLFVLSGVTMAGMLLLLVLTMIPWGQWVGFYLDRARNPIAAYSVNLLGSVAGLWIFAGMAFLWLPPDYWFALAFLLYLFIWPSSRRIALAGLVLLAGSLVLLRPPDSTAVQSYWSPYQKLQVASLGDRQYRISVNNTGYMSMANLTPGFLARNPEIARRYRDQSSYDAPFRFAHRVNRVLIVGAGAGNDAAAALRNGAGHVDAVEIDPVIYALGKRLHPEQPYSSPKVHTILDDARAFLRQTNEKYDVILFGLLDSHTQFSDYSNMRIDNYVYTKEAFREARRLLKPEGVLIVKFEVRARWMWMGQRFNDMLGRVFGRPPIVFYAPRIGRLASATVFIASNDVGLWVRAAQPALASLISENPPHFSAQSSGAPPATSDDWPYVYHRSRSIPRAYLTVSLLLLVMAVLLVRRTLELRHSSTWNFFFLGAGFLLLETQLVSRLALYFGATWLVNCVALSTILLVLVLANFYVTHRKPVYLGQYYILLVGCLLGNYIFPWEQLPYGTRTVGILLSLGYSFPVFFAGIIFTASFRQCPRKSNAFGANIVGAVAGGLAQNLSFVLGLKALLLLAAGCYAAAAFPGLIRSLRGESIWRFQRAEIYTFPRDKSGGVA